MASMANVARVSGERQTRAGHCEFVAGVARGRNYYCSYDYLDSSTAVRQQDHDGGG